MLTTLKLRLWCTSHKYKLNFMGLTNCTQVETEKISSHHFEFMPFAEILASSKEDFLTDVIGHVVKRETLKDFERNSQATVLLQFVLEDLSMDKIQCTFWGQFAEDLHDNLERHSSLSPPVFVIQLCKLKKFQGATGISNSIYGTQVFFNTGLAAILEYKACMLTSEQPLTQTVSRVVPTVPLSLHDELLHTPRKTISELLESTDSGYASVLVQVIEIDNEYSWNYESCHKCLRKVNRVGNRFFCDKCARAVTAVPRFKLAAKVIDETGSVNFVLFDCVVSNFLGKTAQQLLQPPVDESVLPGDFDQFLAKPLLFNG